MATELFIADKGKDIKDTEKYPMTMDKIEKLDKMLSEYGVTHFFSLPIDSTDGIANNDEDYLTVFYDSKDSLSFNLAYALWCKTIRNVDDEMIYESLTKIRKECTI